MTTSAERMLSLFRGNDRGHGTYLREERTPGRAKSLIKNSAKTVRDPPSAALWEQHLAGRRPLGIIPITEQAECWWGVIDVDKYDLDHAKIVQNLVRLRLPMAVCRSKSGGAHLFLFLTEPVPADLMVTHLRKIAGVLGYGDCEIFPKQTQLLEERGDLGNWLNMPYFDAEAGTRYAVSPDGRGLSLEKFLDYAESLRIPRQALEKLPQTPVSKDKDMAEAPPCLQHLTGVGITEGMKNNAMFALGVLAKKMRPEGWENLLDEWNRRYVVDPKLTSEEMNGLFKSLRKKEYNYRCKDQPLVAHCDSRACRTRKFGVSGGGTTPDITSISVLDTQPPLFFVCLTSGGTVECTTDDLVSSRAFQRAVLSQLRMMIPLYAAEDWQRKVQECLDQAVTIEAPREASDTGAMFDLLVEFCTDRHRAMERDEILLGKPWLDEDHGRYYFRLADFIAHLERNKFRDFTRSQIASRIRQAKGAHGFFNLRGKGTNVWWIPAESMPQQTEPFRTPSPGGSPI